MMVILRLRQKIVLLPCVTPYNNIHTNYLKIANKPNPTYLNTKRNQKVNLSQIIDKNLNLTLNKIKNDKKSRYKNVDGADERT